jgi:hypothetical protein
VSERDPRVDPAYLDVVVSCKGIRARQVQLVTALGTVTYLTCKAPRRGKVTFYESKEKRCSLSTWRQWCKGGRVEAHGPEPKQLVLPAGICLDQALLGELTGLRNRLLREGELYGERGISDRRLVNALLKLSVAVLEHHKQYDMPFELRDLERVLQEDGEDEGGEDP